MTDLQTLLSLPLEQQIGQLLFIGLPGTELDAEARALAAQFTLFDSVNQGILDELRGVDVETLSAEEARQLLLGLKKRLV